MSHSKLASQVPYMSRSKKHAFIIIPQLSGNHKIEFSGILPLGWASSLAQGLANRKINILSGYARRTSISQWVGEITVDPGRALENVSDIDFTAIINEKPARVHNQIMLTDFSIRECFRANGSVYIEVEGKDQIGFLAGVLKIFLSCCLFPWDFTIKTEGNYIYDKFHLMGTSGSHVPSQVINMLNIKLNELRRS